MSKILLGGAALVIEQEGITDFSSGLAAGYIPWAEIAGFGPIAFGEQRFLGIAVRDAGTLKARLSGLKARAVDWNLAHGLPHILIPQVVLKQDVEAVAKSMRVFVDTHNLLSETDEQSAS